MDTSGNDASHWREFDENELSHSMAHYLMAIDTLRKEHGYARSTDVADMLSVSRGAASMALAQLKKRGWVGEDHNRFLLLTDDGQRITNHVEHNYLIVSKFLHEILGVDQDTALGDACKIEHLISFDTSQRLLWFMRQLLSDSKTKKKIEKWAQDYEPECGLLDNKEECPVCGDGQCLAAEVQQPN